MYSDCKAKNEWYRILDPGIGWHFIRRYNKFLYLLWCNDPLTDQSVCQQVSPQVRTDFDKQFEAIYCKNFQVSRSWEDSLANIYPATSLPSQYVLETQ